MLAICAALLARCLSAGGIEGLTAAVYAPFDKDRPEWDGEQDEDEFYTAWLTGKPVVEYPNMADKKRLTLGKRSGAIVVAG